MKVLHVIPSIAACDGGPSRVVLDTCRALRSIGVEADIATTNANGSHNASIPNSSPKTVAGVPVYFFERQYPWRYKFSWELTKWLKANVARYDLMHVHAVFSYSTAAAAFYARKQSVPYIMFPHGMLAPWPIRKNWLVKKIYLRAIEQHNLGRASAVHFTAEDELRMSIVRGGSNFVLPCIVDVKKSGKHLRDRRAAKPQILFLSRIDPKKGIDILISALSRLAQQGKEFEFVIAGSGERRYEERVKAMIASSGLSSRTIVKGFIEGDEKIALFEAADVFVLPSHHENFGIAVVEAMACGLPVVISDKVNICHDIDQAGAGLVVEATAESLHSGLLKLIDNPSLRLEMGRRAIEVVERKFCFSSVALEQLQVYRDIINESRQSGSWRPLPQRFISA